MSQDYLNAMEELAKASLFIRDLAKGFVGEVLIEVPAFAVPTEEDLEEHRRAVEEIHQGQLDMAALGWSRAPKFLVDRMWTPQHNTEFAAWFKDDHEAKETKWIRCTIMRRFGLRAKFWSTTDPGERMIGIDEIRELAGEHYGVEVES
jgi:hypothetical protein